MPGSPQNLVPVPIVEYNLQLHLGTQLMSTPFMLCQQNSKEIPSCPWSTAVVVRVTPDLTHTNSTMYFSSDESEGGMFRNEALNNHLELQKYAHFYILLF